MLGIYLHALGHEWLFLCVCVVLWITGLLSPLGSAEHHCNRNHQLNE